MALVLTKEDGTGLPDSNSYASVADGDNYHAGHLYASLWTAASEASKAAALVMATRLIDSECEFLGDRRSVVQALRWPRVEVPDRDAPGVSVGRWIVTAPTLPSGRVPKCVVEATCELARELIKKDRTAEPVGLGLKSTLASGVELVFDKTDRAGVMTDLIWTMLRGVVEGGRGCARLVRT